MNQSGLLAGALIAGFLLWLAMQGRLQAYYSLLIGGGTGGGGSTPPTVDQLIPHPLGGTTTNPATPLDTLPLFSPEFYLHPFGSELS